MGGYQLQRQIIVLRVWRQEPVFDVTSLYQANGRVNSHELSVLGETVPIESMVLWSYRPTTVRRIGQTGPVDTEMLFKFREPISDDDKPWQAHFQNVGYNGFTGTDGKKAPFRLTANSDPISEPIPLGNTGKPLYGSYKVGPENKDPKAVQESDGHVYYENFPPMIEGPSGQQSPRYWTLLYPVRKTRDFRGFIPGIM